MRFQTYIRTIRHSRIKEITITNDTVAPCLIAIQIVSAAQRILVAVVGFGLCQVFAHGRARTFRIQIDFVVDVSLNEIRQFCVRRRIVCGIAIPNFAIQTPNEHLRVFGEFGKASIEHGTKITCHSLV